MKKTVMDWYLRWPLISDVAMSVLFYFLIDTFLLLESSDETKTTHVGVMNSVISTCVSLAGFILAALTIIVTFKSNLKAKGINEAEDAMELILSSRHYDSIVSVFKVAIVEFVLITIGLYLASAFVDELRPSFIQMLTLCSISLTSLTICRSLFVLFKILNLEKRNMDQKRR
jgi:hypothetical protein